MKVVYFNYAAVGILLAMFISALLKKMTKGRANFLFLTTVTEVTITALFSVWSITLDNRVSSGLSSNHTALFMSHMGFLFFNNLNSLFYALYVIMLTDRVHKIRKGVLTKILLIVPLLLQTILLIVNIFTPVLFYISDTGVYTRCSLFPLIYIVPAFYMIYGLIYIIYARKLFSTRWIVTLFSPYPLVFGAVILEFFIKEITISAFSYALALSFVFSNIQRPEEIIDHKTSLNNDYSFKNDCVKSFINEKEFGVLAVNILNYEAILDTMTSQGEIKFLKEITNEIITTLKNTNTKYIGYYIRNGQFRFTIEYPKENILEAVNAVFKSLTEKEKYSYSAFYQSTYWIMCPTDVKNYEELKMFNSSPLASMVKDNLILAKDIVDNREFRISLEIDRITDYAIRNERFEVYYQPIFSVEKRAFTSAEALLRLQTADYGFINPEVIVTAAEKNGLILPIGQLVLEKVCQFIKSDEFKDLGIEYVEVNMSVAQCMQENMANTIIETLKKYNVEPANINLEITETAVAKSGDLLMKNIKTLSDYGIHFSLDDFGSGYSNLERISKLPISLLKIDKSLSGDYSNPRGAAVLRNTISMARELELETVIEGVETKEQLECFKSWDSAHIQGYYFSKPVPLTEFIHFIKMNK